MQDIRMVSCVITVHHCCNHWGRLSTAILNTVSPPFPGELLEKSPCPILLCPSLVLLSCFLAPLSPSQQSFFSLFADSASISLNPLCSAVFCFLRVTFVHAYLALSVVVTPPSVRACRHQRRYQTGCPL